MELVRRALRRARGDRARSVATLLAIFAAVTSFVVLTGHASTQRLEVTRTAEENYRASYDILVRPTGSTLGLEASEGLVRTNFLSGQYGGITVDQVEQVRALPGVQIAAPIAMVGYYYQTLPITQQIADLLPQGERGLVRYRTEITARNGTATHVGPAGYYTAPRPSGNPPDPWPARVAGYASREAREEEPQPCRDDGGEAALFRGGKHPRRVRAAQPARPGGAREFQCQQRRPVPHEQGELDDGPHLPIPAALSATHAGRRDRPRRRGGLVGLDEAVFEGRYLTTEDT